MRDHLLTSAGLVALAFVVRPVRGGDCFVPPNENCDGAIVFTSADLPLATEGLLGCENDVADKPYWDVFYRYDCEMDGAHTFDMCDSERDTYIRIYINGCGFRDGDELAVGDDECPSAPPNADPQITVDLEAGRSYWIELGTWRPDLPWGEPNAAYFFNVTVDAETCEGDVTGDGVVGFADVVELLASWGPCGETCSADFDESGVVDFVDLLVLLAAWGPCP